MKPHDDLFIEQFVDENLGNSSYLVGATRSRQGVVIDPPRHVEPQLAAAKRHRIGITEVLETHLHNDFVSGARELEASTGATIAASRLGGVTFHHHDLSDGDRIPVGDAVLRTLATPGHTPEHLAFTLVPDDGADPIALFSGGALIVGGAARTDLLGPEQTGPLTHQLFDTLRRKLLTLPAGVRVYPTHGAGSFCAAPRSDDRVTTIGRELATNALAQATTEEEFAALATRGLPAYPLYFKEMRGINRRGPRLLRELPAGAALSPRDLLAWAKNGGAVLDVRPTSAFAHGHVPGAYGITVDAPLTTWAGWLIPFGTPLALVSENAAEREEALAQLVTIGYDEVRGYLDGGMEAWRSAGLPTEGVPTIRAEELRARLASPDPPLVLDVREDSEWALGHLPAAVHLANGRLPWEDLPLPRDRPIVVHCGHEARSTAGISVLARRGFHDLTLLQHGYSGWREAGFEVVRDRGGDG